MRCRRASAYVDGNISIIKSCFVGVGFEYQLSATAIWLAKMGPITSPMFEVNDEAKKAQLRPSDPSSNKSSIVLMTVMRGIADTKPVTKRPTNTAAIFGVAATGMQKTLKRDAGAT